MNLPPHELLSASAGTGKTHQLTSRYLRLLFSVGEPERIVALTFTRKAAAEFFYKIFQRLAGGAESAEGAATLSRELGVAVDRPTCYRHLRLLLDRLHRLQLSTYDSFFNRIVQTFPFELGLAGPTTLLDHQQQAQAIRQAQEALSRRAGIDSDFFQQFWFACRRATMGAETKGVADLVAEFIANNHSLFFDAPDAQQWGEAEAIWGGDCPWSCPAVDLAAEAGRLRGALPWADMKRTQRTHWEEYVTQLATWVPPAPMPKRVAAFTAKFLLVYRELDTGRCVVTVKSPQVLDAVVGQSVRRITCYCFWVVLQPRLEATRGIYDVVRLFEDVYATEIRRKGRITLEDATRLLAGGPHGQGLAEANLRDSLGYRLDGWFDHWLLDEFQDTSHAQWAAIRDLVDEVIQDPEKRRSFFAVGDTKQSIYRWRGSDDRLFGRVAARYASALHRRTMEESYRSAPTVLSMVNQVFGDTASLAEIAGTAVAARWAEGWVPHRSAAPRQADTGASCLLHAPEEDEECFATVLQLLQAIGPLERGLSAAVLTRENKAADRLVEYLRAHGGPACSLAANVQVGKDSVVAAGLRSLLTIAAHPADRQAWVHLQMSPMGRALEDAHPTPAALSACLRQIWSDRGLAGLVDEWARWCRPHIDPSDTFSTARLQHCRQLAVDQDQAGEVDIDAFIEALQTLELREHDVPGQVAVMTVHKAKGLDWDIVILTDLAGNTLRERPTGKLEVQRGADGDVRWILDLPSADVARHDDVLGARIEESEDDAAFERLCTLYVGMTRARRGLFVVTQAARGESRNYHRLMDTTLGAEPRPVLINGTAFTCAWHDGDLNWFIPLKPAAVRPAPSAEINWLPTTERRTGAVYQSVQPSGSGAKSIRGVQLALSSAGRRFGSLVHEALARVEWLPPTEAAEEGMLADATADLEAPAAAAVRAVLAEGPSRSLFERKGRWNDVWRELPFECIDGDAWISGRFDRVLLERDAQGVVRRALLIDFKTAGGAGRPDLRVYEAQLGRYRTVLARLCAIPVDRIDACVVVIQPGHVDVQHLVAPAAHGVDAGAS